MEKHILTIFISVLLFASCEKKQEKDTQSIDWENVIEGEVQANAVIDIDGKSYSAVKIGEQVWMAENLAYLPRVDDNSTFAGSTDARYGVYGYDGNNVNLSKAEDNYSTYGVLYNWYAAMAGRSSRNDIPSGVQGICPTGWHLPSDAEWIVLEMTLGVPQKEANYIGWRGTNEGSKLAGYSDLWNNGDLKNNPEFGTSGYSALPGGGRWYRDGTSLNQSNNGYWWSSTQNNSTDAYCRYLHEYGSTINRYGSNKSNGFSVRCVMD